MHDPGMIDDAALDRATRHVRTVALVAWLPLVMVLTWSAITAWLRPTPPPGAVVAWETLATVWVRRAWSIPLPFALAVAASLFGPTCTAVGGALLLGALRRAPWRVTTLLPLAVVLSACSLATTPWISVEWGWTLTTPDGSESYGMNHSPGPCCGVWQIGLTAWLLWAHLRFGPVFRTAAPDGR